MVKKTKCILLFGIFYVVPIFAQAVDNTQEGLQQRMQMLGQLLSQAQQPGVQNQTQGGLQQPAVGAQQQQPQQASNAAGENAQDQQMQAMQQAQQLQMMQNANVSGQQQAQIPQALQQQQQQILQSQPNPPPNTLSQSQPIAGNNVYVPAAANVQAQNASQPQPQSQLPPTAGSMTAGSSGGGMYEDSFGGVVNQMLPMTPDQIARLRWLFNETQRAASTPAGVPGKPVTTSISVNLSPQATPPVIRLGAGFISSLVFLDSTGQPWPISAYSIGDSGAFNIQWDKKSNDLLIQALSFYKRSNLAVILKGLDTPVMLTLLAGQEAIDYRVDLRIPGMGPNAVSSAQNGLPDVANPILLDVLNGIPPRGSKALRVIGGDAQAWLLKNKLYLRTRMDVISPAWKAVMNSADGTHAYELQPSPVILALQRGKDKTLTLTLEGFE